MANPTGKSESDAVRLDFDRRLMLRFRGSETCTFVTSLLQPSKRERCMFGAGGDDTILRKSVPMLSGQFGVHPGNPGSESRSVLKYVLLFICFGVGVAAAIGAIQVQ